jgi:hypothetical protein
LPPCQLSCTPKQAHDAHHRFNDLGAQIGSMLTQLSPCSERRPNEATSGDREVRWRIPWDITMLYRP